MSSAGSPRGSPGGSLVTDPLGYTSRTERKTGYRNIVHSVCLIGLAERTGSVIQQILFWILLTRVWGERCTRAHPLGGRPSCGTLLIGSLTGGDWLDFPVLGWIRSSPPRKWPHRWRCQPGHLTEADTPSPQNWGGGQSGTPWGRALNPRALTRSRPVGTCGDSPMDTFL